MKDHLAVIIQQLAIRELYYLKLKKVAHAREHCGFMLAQIEPALAALRKLRDS